ncbi:MAG TPA: HD-GYP domain-containing protein [Longimicrobiales bacterium]|nr:HD-GYP domain-containing protein [Longimicrobiales bacterium]
MSTPQPPIVRGGGSLQVQGQALLIGMHAAAQALKLYPVENAAVQKALDELHRTVMRVIEREGTLELKLIGDFVFLNDARLRLDLSNYTAVSFFGNALARHGVGTVTVDPAVSRNEWAPFLSLLLQDPPESADPFERFTARLANTPVSRITVSPTRDPDQRPGTDTRSRELAKKTYVQSVQVAREVLTDFRLGKAVNVRRVKRAVQSIVDQVLNDESSMIGMTVLRDFDEYTFTHSVNVCIFSVVLGQKLGLSKLQLYELGLGALFHDIGKMRIDPDIINKAEGLTEDEFDAIREHPTEGLLALFNLNGFGEVPYRAMLMAYEHHMKIDLTGYPRNRRKRTPSLFSRIVAVADGFDAATSRRSYQSLPWPPDRVLAEMQNNPKRGFDPLVVKAFINVTGVYPVGTLVILDTYELAVVYEPNPDPSRIHQPVVKIIADPMGIPLAEPVLADLSEIDPVTGHPKRTIIKTTDPEKYGINVGEYFL